MILDKAKKIKNNVIQMPVDDARLVIQELQRMIDETEDHGWGHIIEIYSYEEASTVPMLGIIITPNKKEKEEEEE